MSYVTYTDRYTRTELGVQDDKYNAVLELVLQDLAILERQTSHVLQQGVGDEARVFMSTLCGAVRTMLRYYHRANPDHVEQLARHFMEAGLLEEVP